MTPTDPADLDDRVETSASRSTDCAAPSSTSPPTTPTNQPPRSASTTSATPVHRPGPSAHQRRHRDVSRALALAEDAVYIAKRYSSRMYRHD